MCGKILILGGTSTTHEIINSVGTDDYIISVATEYGKEEFEKKYPEKVVLKKFTNESLKNFIDENSISKVIDSTHPHALEITSVAKKVTTDMGIEYISKVRSLKINLIYENAYFFSSYADILSFILNKKYKNIIITIGGNNISHFKDVSSYSYVRVLPFEKSIKACVAAGFDYSRIIAMQGPFSEKLNNAFIEEFDIDCLVTKNSGKGSGFQEKANACIAKGIDLLIMSPE